MPKVTLFNTCTTLLEERTREWDKIRTMNTSSLISLTRCRHYAIDRSTVNFWLGHHHKSGHSVTHLSENVGEPISPTAGFGIQGAGLSSGAGLGSWGAGGWGPRALGFGGLGAVGLGLGAWRWLWGGARGKGALGLGWAGREPWGRRGLGHERLVFGEGCGARGWNWGTADLGTGRWGSEALRG